MKHNNNWCLIRNLQVTKHAFLLAISDSMSLKPQFFCKSLEFESGTVLCLFLVVTNLVHIVVAQFENKKGKQLLKPLFFCRNLGSSDILFPYLTEAPLPDPTPTPPNTPKRTRNGPETDLKRTQTDPNGPETDPNGPETDPKRTQTDPKWTEIKLSGWDGRGVLSGRGGGGGCKGKRKSLA